MITLRELSDNKNDISSTRWAFAVIVLLDVVVIVITVLAVLIGHFIKKPIDKEIFSGVATLLSVPTTLITVAKSLMGFETHKNNVNKQDDNDNGQYTK